MARSMEEIAGLLKQTRFKSRFIGGVDEDDVWSKLSRMQQEYEALVSALQEQCNGVVYQYQAKIQKLQQRLREVEEYHGSLAAEDTPVQAWEHPPAWQAQPPQKAQPLQTVQQAPPPMQADRQPPQPQQAAQTSYVRQQSYAQRQPYAPEMDRYLPQAEENARAEAAAVRPQGQYLQYAGSAQRAQSQFEQASPYIAGYPYGRTEETPPAREARADTQRHARALTYEQAQDAPWNQAAAQPTQAQRHGAPAYPMYAAAQEAAPRAGAEQNGKTAPVSGLVRYHLHGDVGAGREDTAPTPGKSIPTGTWLNPIAQPLAGGRHG